MDPQVWTQGIAQWLCIVVIITLHEFGHAWMATRCGDDTARLLGRVTLNPLAHIDPIGTVALPLLALFLTAGGAGAAAGFIIGWGKPVPFNPQNLKRRGLDDVLIAMAGPAMNIVLTVIVLGVWRVTMMASGGHAEGGAAGSIMQAAGMMALLSMYLFFFNLIPVPPLDGSHVLRYFSGMSYETYSNIARYGFFIIIILIQIQPVRAALSTATFFSLSVFMKLFGIT